MSWFQTGRWRRQRQSQIVALRSPSAPAESVPDFTPPAPLELVDWPAIQSRHPTWWQVHRIELEGTERRLVLIAECRSEEAAFQVAAQQAAQVRITRWGSKQRPYESFRPPLMRVVGTVRLEE